MYFMKMQFTNCITVKFSPSLFRCSSVFITITCCLHGLHKNLAGQNIQFVTTSNPTYDSEYSQKQMT